MTTTSSPSRPWTPSDRDRMIYRWVKFDGHKQSWVAQQLEINQSTVSRVVERYERWVAHGGPAQQGALTRDERLRAQRWLTYERNEWMLTSALRMASEMERMSESRQTELCGMASDAHEGGAKERAEDLRSSCLRTGNVPVLQKRDP